MRLLIICLGTIIATAGTAISQSKPINRITLSWNSFINTNKTNLPYIAYTAHKTMYKYRAIKNGNKVQLKFDVAITLDTPNTIVNRERLKKLRSDAQSRLLNHEQLHTDLAVIYGRMLYQRLSRETYTPQNFKTKTRGIYLDLMKTLAEENFKYDVETEHGFNQEKQALWAEKVKKLIK